MHAIRRWPDGRLVPIVQDFVDCRKGKNQNCLWRRGPFPIFTVKTLAMVLLRPRSNTNLRADRVKGGWSEMEQNWSKKDQAKCRRATDKSRVSSVPHIPGRCHART